MHFLSRSKLLPIYFAFLYCQNSLSAVALVYTGPGSCEDDCSGAAAQIARMAGMEFRFVSPDQLKPAVFAGADLWIQPGGNSIEVAQTLGTGKLGLIREFVRNGGGYVGFCAGAFLTDQIVDDETDLPGLGIIPLTTAYFPADSGLAGTVLDVNWRGRARSIFFNGGATFVLDPRYPVEVLAIYGDGQPATISTSFGLGKVVITGLHPEATETWKLEANRQDFDGSDQDLAVDMVRRAQRSFRFRH